MTLLVMAGCGMAMGICFDTVGAVVREFRFRRAIQALLDIVYWAAATIFVFQALLYANDGEVRLFIFIGLGIGVLLYALLAGTWYRRFIAKLLRFLLAVIAQVFRLIRILLIRPLLVLYRLLIRIAALVAGFVAAVAIFLGKFVLQWGMKWWKWIRARLARRKE